MISSILPASAAYAAPNLAAEGQLAVFRRARSQLPVAADGGTPGAYANRGRDLLDSRGGEDEHSVNREGLCCAPQRGDEAGMMQWIWIVAFTWAALLYFAPELFQLYRRWSLARKRARTLKKWHASARTSPRRPGISRV